MPYVTHECRKFGLLIGLGRANEDLIRWVVCVPVGDCGAESRVGVWKGGVWCNCVECILGEEVAGGGGESNLDCRRHDDGGDCFGVARHRGSCLVFCCVLVKFGVL